MNSNVNLPSLLSMSLTSASSVVNELLNEFITEISDEPVYNLSFRGQQATWTYDVDSDISYEANLAFTTDIDYYPTICLNIYEGYTLIDSIRFERLDSPNGFIWEEIE